MEENALLTVRDLKKYFPVKRGILHRTVGWIKAVDGVSFDIHESKTLGLVGESGCGKTTLARALVRLIEPDCGQMRFLGRDLRSFSYGRLRLARKDLQIVFQDPFNSLDPRFSVSEIIQEGINNFTPRKDKKKIPSLTENILNLVGLPKDSLLRFPHEFSGGQRQRISIARSLILNPRLLILDEPVSSLDVSIQAQIINLLLELQEKLKLAYLFISHDLSVVKSVCDEVCVMYLGRIVEQAPGLELFKNPFHPYTKLLIESSNLLRLNLEYDLDNLREERDAIKPAERRAVDSQGCNFKNRCRFSKDICKEEPPFFYPHKNRKVTCWLYR